MNKEIIEIGSPPWDDNELIESLNEFELVYANRPIKENIGGVRAPHAFALWFMAKNISPDVIIESGVLKGQTTWILEQACPNSKGFSIDINLRQRTYISENVTYFSKDFSEIDWTKLVGGGEVLAFFDDHQDAYQRVRQCRDAGIKHIIFEDNYPAAPKGDFYSLRKALAGVGFEPIKPQHEDRRVSPNIEDAANLRRWIDIYYEFPPVVRVPKTRWGDEWSDVNYPTKKPLLSINTSRWEFVEEAMYYTWICYVRLANLLRS